jgi:hypothetical protein
MLMGKSLVKPRKRWEDNIKMDLKEVFCVDGRCMELVHDRVQWWALVLEVFNLRVLSLVG